MSIFTDGKWMNFEGAETGSRGREEHYITVEGVKEGQVTQARTGQEHENRGNAIVIDSSEIREFMRSLSYKEVDKAISNAWKECFRIIYDATRANVTGSGLRKGRKLAKGVKMGLKKYHGEMAYAYVHVMGKEKSPYPAALMKYADRESRKAMADWRSEHPAFALRFFEKGTAERHTETNLNDTFWRNGSLRKRARLRKGHSTGSVAAYRFLQRAATASEGQVYGSFDSKMSAVISKMINKAKERK